MRILGMVTRGVCLAAMVAPAGCASSAPRDTERPFTYRRLDPKHKELCLGAYRALDLGNHLVVYATGTHSSMGYPVALEVIRPSGAVPRLALYHGRPAPEGAVLPAFGTFIVSAVLEHRWVPNRPRIVIVRDARGNHEVEVKAPAEVLTSEERDLVCPGPTLER